MSGYYKSRHRHRLAVSPKRGVSSYRIPPEKRHNAFHVKKDINYEDIFVIPGNFC